MQKPSTIFLIARHPSAAIVSLSKTSIGSSKTLWGVPRIFWRDQIAFEAHSPRLENWPKALLESRLKAPGGSIVGRRSRAAGVRAQAIFKRTDHCTSAFAPWKKGLRVFYATVLDLELAEQALTCPQPFLSSLLDRWRKRKVYLYVLGISLIETVPFCWSLEKG